MSDAPPTPEQKIAEADLAADIENLKKFHDEMYELCAGSVTRNREAADKVQTASAALLAIYTGILGLVFSVTSNPLPLRGILAPMFLGLAVVLATYYLAYVKQTDRKYPGPEPAIGLERKAMERLNAFIRVTRSVSLRRVGALRAAVISLGVGLAYMALPFLTWNGPSAATGDGASSASNNQASKQGRGHVLGPGNENFDRNGEHAEEDEGGLPSDFWLTLACLGGGIAVVVLIPRSDLLSYGRTEDRTDQLSPNPPATA